MRGNRKNVMLNLVQHLTISRTYETLKQVQGDKIVITTQPHEREGVKGADFGRLMIGNYLEFGIWIL